MRHHALPLKLAKGIDPVRFPSTHALLSLWVRPWSPTAERYCTHALLRVWRVVGVQVLD